jgi:acyl-CoA synthetase (AMP-forming)/AMP-acid ligase II
MKCQPNKIAYTFENAKEPTIQYLSLRNMALNDKGNFEKPKFNELYWSKNKDVWYHGDLVSVDSNRFWYILGRADDVIKTS